MFLKKCSFCPHEQIMIKVFFCFFIINYILQYNHKSDHAQEELAKFGYNLVRNFFLTKLILLYFGDLLEPIVEIWKFQSKIKNPQNLMSLAHVFTKILCEFGHQVVKIHQKKKHLLLIVEIIIF